MTCGGASPHTHALSFQKVRSGPRDACAQRGAPGPHRVVRYPQESLKGQRACAKGPSRGMQGGREARAGQRAGLRGTRAPCGVPMPHHSPVRPAPCTLGEGLPPRHPAHFYSMSLCLHPRENSKKKKKESLRQNLRTGVGALSSTARPSAQLGPPLQQPRPCSARAPAYPPPLRTLLRAVPGPAVGSGHGCAPAEPPECAPWPCLALPSAPDTTRPLLS